jgi:hypothetical protein
VFAPAAAAGSGVAGSEGEDSMSAALHKVVHEVLGDELTLTEAKQMLAEVDATNNGKISLSEVSMGGTRDGAGDRGGEAGDRRQSQQETAVGVGVWVSLEQRLLSGWGGSAQHYSTPQATSHSAQ